MHVRDWLILTATIVALVIALSGCADLGGGPGHRVVSQALLDPMPQIVREAIESRREAGQAVPEGAASAEFAETVIESIQVQHPTVFMVEPQQNFMYSFGLYNDLNNRATLDRLLEECEAQGATLSTVASYLVEQHRKEPLSGVRLEIAVRLVDAQLSSALIGGVMEALD